MAKSLKQQQAQIGKEFDELAKIQSEYDKLLAKKAKGQKIDEDRLKQLQNEYGSIDKLSKKVDSLADSFNNYNKKIDDSNKKLAKSIENFDDVEESINSIGFGIAKNQKLYDAFNSKIDSAKTTLQSVSAILQNQKGLSQNQIDNAEKASEAYKKVFTSVGDASKELKRGNVTQSEFNEIVRQSYKEFETLIDNIDDSTEAGKALKQTFTDAYKEVEQFNKAAQKSAKAMDALDTAVDQLGSSGIPVVGELGTAFQKLANKDVKGAKVAITALGAAVGGLAGKYFGAEFDAARVAANDVKQTQIDGTKEIAKIQSDAAFIPQKIQLEKDKSAIESANEIAKLQNDASFAAQKAANSFAASMKEAAAQFQAASKTALFGNKLGSVGYGASQLQMAGISAEKIAGAMSAASAATGKMPTAKMGADFSIMAERTGTSVEDIASINEAFQRMDGLSANMALNMQEGMRNMADQAGISLGNLMKEVAESSKEALGYQIKSGPALAKQVAYAQSLGVSFGDIAKAGKSMVMNYKDSIKAEMQLSSLLGEQVDLSEVRAQFAAGDTEGALKSLQAQGLDPAQMDMFQQEALSQALGGMDLSSLSKIATGTGAQVGGLQAGKAGAQNQAFLGRTQQAQAGLAAQQAQISADAAIVDAKLAEQINQAYLGSEAYTTYQKALSDAAIKEQELTTQMTAAFQQTPGYITSIADATKLSIERSFTENIGPALGATVGGILSNYLANVAMPGGGSVSVDGGGIDTPDGGKGGGKGGKKGIFGKIGGFFGKVTSGAKGLFKGGGIGKILGGAGKLGKMIPGLSNILSVGGAVSNLMSGNFASAGLDLLGAIPGVGNVLNIARATGLTSGIEASLNEKVGGMMPKGVSNAIGMANQGASVAKSAMSGNIAEAVTGAASMAGIAPAAAAIPAAAPGKPAIVDIPATSPIVKSLETGNKDAEDRMKRIAGNIERIFVRTDKTANFTFDMVNKLATLNTNTMAMVNLTRKIEALTAATYEGSKNVELSIDGKRVAYAFNRYKANTTGTDPNNPTGTPIPG